MGRGSTRAAAAALFREHAPRVRRYIHHMVRSEADADDLLQETFLRVSRALPQFRRRARPSTWIHRIATNVCLDFFRRREAGRGEAAAVRGAQGKQGEQEAEGAAEAPPLTPEALFAASEMGECIRGYVDGLPGTFRAVLVLRDLEGFSNPEVAAILGWSVDRVKITLHRARRRLKGVLAERCTFYRDERNVLRCDRRPPCGKGSPGCGS